MAQEDQQFDIDGTGLITDGLSIIQCSGLEPIENDCRLGVSSMHAASSFLLEYELLSLHERSASITRLANGNQLESLRFICRVYMPTRSNKILLSDPTVEPKATNHTMRVGRGKKEARTYFGS